jgi:4-hydroxy-3-methylbut-2-enyl diphosphate reductase IspH
VGVTAGTSTPDASIDEVQQWLNQLASRRNLEQPAHVVAELQHRQAA